MKYLKVLLCQTLLLASALSSPVDEAAKDKKPSADVAPKVNETKNINKEEVEHLSNSQTEKPATKKRDIPEVFNEKFEYMDDDSYEGRPVSDYDNIQFLRSYLDKATSGNSMFDGNRFTGGDNYYRYYNDDSRRKRTAIADEVFNRPDGYYQPQISMTPEEIMALAAFRQQPRVYKLEYGRWNDINNALDVTEPEMMDDNFYNDRQDNFYDDSYDKNSNNNNNFHLFPRNDQLAVNRYRKNLMDQLKLPVPLYRRAIL